MEFWTFLYELKSDNDFLDDLSRLNCHESKLVREKINRGYDIFHSISSITDEFGKLLLSARGIMVLNYLGKYYITKNKIKYNINSNLMYPASLSVLLLLLQIYLYKINMLNIGFLSFWVIQQILCIIITMIIYRYIKQHLQHVIVLILFKCFLHRCLSFENLLFLLKSINIEIKEYDDFETIFLRVVKYPFINNNNLDNLIDSGFKDVMILTQKMILVLQITLFIIAAVVIVCTIKYVSNNIMNNWIFFQCV